MAEEKQTNRYETWETVMKECMEPFGDLMKEMQKIMVQKAELGAMSTNSDNCYKVCQSEKSCCSVGSD